MGTSWNEGLNNLVNKRFGKLLVKERIGRRNGKTWYLCKCDCGKVKRVEHSKVQRNKSCGCLIGGKKEFDRKIIEDLYLNKDFTIKKSAKILGIKDSTFSRILKYHNIDKKENAGCFKKGQVGRNKGNKTGKPAWNRGRSATREQRLKMSESAKRLWQNPEHRKKQSKAHAGGVVPGFNKTACEYFNKFDKANGTCGQHATNGGEYRIDGLRYYLDYINFDLKLIMEWDEEYHHYKGGKLLKKDTQRQKEIEQHFPEYRFIRLRECEVLSEGEIHV